MIKRFIAQMVIALKFLKEKNIIHRDIKPKNILIHQDGIKISDFGVAKIINNHNADQETTTFSGTIQFMSPQILRQEKYTFQTDVWSLGITIYYMLFLRVPWVAQKVLGILKEIGEEVPIPEANISPLLRDLLQRMLTV
jgi:NIMA (never in mitosis gene a)-related kinase 1/4/5